VKEALIRRDCVRAAQQPRREAGIEPASSRQDLVDERRESRTERYALFAGLKPA
jgi:hypothetical protein